jgi:hypothetical protein
LFNQVEFLPFLLFFNACNFCFLKILREAFELQTQLRPIIIGNSIKFSLIQNFDLIISLEHNNFNNLNSEDDGLKKKTFMKNFVCNKN